MTRAPRLLSETAAAEYCSLDLATFRTWVKNGRLPQPIAGVYLWDVRAIDEALDRLSGLGTPQNALDAWLESENARRA